MLQLGVHTHLDSEMSTEVTGRSAS
jgi:hypothetical protein